MGIVTFLYFSAFLGWKLFIEQQEVRNISGSVIGGSGGAWEPLDFESNKEVPLKNTCFSMSH